MFLLPLLSQQSISRCRFLANSRTRRRRRIRLLTVDSDRFNGIRDNRSIKGCERCFAFFPLILSACLSFCISSLYGSSRFLFEIGNSKYRFEYIIGARGKFKWIKSKYPFFIGINSPLNICPFDGFPFVGDIFLAIWVNNKYRFTVISTCIEHVEGTIETVERRRRVKYNLRQTHGSTCRSSNRTENFST